MHATAQLVHRHLVKLGIETPMDGDYIRHAAGREHAIEESVHDIMEILGLDLEDDSLQNTPKRVAKMFTQEMFYGLDYANFPRISLFANKMKVDEMVVGKCSLISCCEHHFVPFIGTAHFAYLPKTKIVGLSKFNRVVDFFARRPQVQERLTAQIVATLQLVLETQDVACVIRAQHMCVHIRGVKDIGSETITSKMGGKFLSKPAARQEFLALTR